MARNLFDKSKLTFDDFLRTVEASITNRLLDESGYKSDALLTTEEAAKALDVTPGTLTVWRSTNRHPELEYLKIGRNVRYRTSVVCRFKDLSTRTHTRESRPSARRR